MKRQYVTIAAAALAAFVIGVGPSVAQVSGPSTSDSSTPSVSGTTSDGSSIS